MDAVVLAGGKGTRLAPYNTVFPKPMIPLGDRPILDIIIKQLDYYRFDRIILSVGYLAELIESYYKSACKRATRSKIEFVRENEPLGTVGALKLVENLNESFLVMNGDILTDMDFGKFMQFHKHHEGLLTIATYNKKVNLELGIMEVDKSHVIQSFQEKPTFNYLVSMGIYAYEPTVLEFIPNGKAFDFPQLVWDALDQKKKLVAYPSEDYWLDLGSHVDYGKAQDEFELMKSKLIHES